MKSFFEEGVVKELIARIDKLTDSSLPIWGKMNAGQMLSHCQIPLHIALKKKNYNLKPNWLIKLLFKKSMYNDKLWRKNVPTPKEFIVNSPKEFQKEKDALLVLIKELHQLKDKDQWDAHPVFGHLSKDQWGKMQYKHLDHHLRQFGV